MTFTIAAMVALAMSPLEKNAPFVAGGIDAYAAGKFDQALTEFEAAARERPNDARMQFNLAATLHKLGRDADAKQALTKAEELDPKHEYDNQIQYNRGTIAAAEGKRDEAIKAFRKALRANPNDGEARHNLEVTLRDLPPKQDQGPDGGASDAGSRDGGPDGGGAGADGGHDGGRPDGGSGDAGQKGDAGKPPDGGQPGDGGTPGDGGSGDGGQGGKPQPGDGGADQNGQRGDAGSTGGSRGDGGIEDDADQPVMMLDGGLGLSKREAEKALDSMKNGEKNLQLWRFKQKSSKNDNNGKDW